MRSLFLKILLWFGLTMLLVNVVSFVTGVIIERRSQPPRTNPAAPMFGVYAQTAAEIFEKDGRDALSSYLERVERASRIHAVVLDARGAELSGRAIPAGAEVLAKHANETTSFVFDFLGHREQPLAAQLVRGPSGSLYTMVGAMPRPDFPRPPPRLGEPGSFLFGLHLLGQSLIPVLLIGVVFCYWLARYLSTPIVKLRDTTHKLSEGNLAARVNDGLTKRRDEIGYLGREFNLMAERIESLVKAQQRLLSDISHELRSPLTRLGVALELARRRAGADATAPLDRIAREAESINELIGQLLTLSRVETGADGLDSVRLDIYDLLESISEDADFEARSRNRSVSVKAGEDCTTFGVPELLRSAIENVVRNAVRYTAEGTEVEIALRCESIEGSRQAVIQVRDHGDGVSEEAIDQIFRPFYRVEDARDRQSGGTGLGLAIAARAVRLHGGTIKAMNAQGGGLVVEIRLPLRESNPQQED